ncbi:MAG TPA: LacI family DNA-binding transcriptional regulator, partial [Thermomicrobiales bacterium]|nr:LacI family DNA-binding transcriptional regulator [Thermomicrobiales bacterium]
MSAPTKDDAPPLEGHGASMATIQDVANRAGVSISTVSRVINQTVPVEPETAERVREAIDALGYRPNLLARSFRRRVTHTIGLIVPDNSNPFFA